MTFADYYYYATAGGAKLWVWQYSLFGCLTMPLIFFQWKKYLTTMQITQFVIDISVVYFGSE